MTLHRALQIGFGSRRGKIQGCIERVKLELIAMLAARRARPAISAFSKSIPAADTLRRLSFADRSRVRRNVPNDPVIERATRRIGIIDNQNEILRTRRNSCERERR